jgi:hypothetical protein
LDFCKGGALNKYSVQFELMEDNLLCSAIKLNDAYCESFPITTSIGYVNYKHIPIDPPQSFWFSVTRADDLQEAYRKAVIQLTFADLEKPFPLHLKYVQDDLPKNMELTN